MTTEIKHIPKGIVYIEDDAVFGDQLVLSAGVPVQRITKVETQIDVEDMIARLLTTPPSPELVPRLVFVDLGLPSPWTRDPRFHLTGIVTTLMLRALFRDARWTTKIAILTRALWPELFLAKPDGVLAKRDVLENPRQAQQVPHLIDLICEGLLTITPSARPAVEQLIGIRRVPPGLRGKHEPVIPVELPSATDEAIVPLRRARHHTTPALLPTTPEAYERLLRLDAARWWHLVNGEASFRAVTVEPVPGRIWVANARVAIVKAALREVELPVLEQLAAGMSLKQAGARLYLSPRTVESHYRRARERFLESTDYDLPPDKSQASRILIGAEPAFRVTDVQLFSYRRPLGSELPPAQSQRAS